MTAAADHFVYILACADGTYYVGHTRDPFERLKAHNDGRGAGYTRARRPVRMVFTEAHASEDEALAREQQLKRWSHAKKRALIVSDTQTLQLLIRSRD